MTNVESKSPSMSHIINLESRKNLTVTGVKEVDSFDECEVVACTDMGKLLIKGQNLNIKKLNLETYDLEITGKITSLDYLDNSSFGKNRFFGKIFK